MRWVTFSEGLARVMHNDRWGYIDKMERKLFLVNTMMRMIFQVDGQMYLTGGIIFDDKTGNTIPKNYWLGRGGYLEAGDFLMVLPELSVLKYVLSPKVWYWGFIDIDGMK